MENISQFHNKEENSSVAKSFEYLINSYLNNKAEPMKEVDIKNDYSNNFCNNHCKAKFENVIERIKNKEIQLDKIAISQLNEKDNIISNALYYYYQIGYWTALQEKQANDNIV